jgi:hypothetical protein
VEYFLIEAKIVLLAGDVSVPLMKPGDKDGEVLSAFEEALLGEVEEVADGCSVDRCAVHFVFIC